MKIEVDKEEYEDMLEVVRKYQEHAKEYSEVYRYIELRCGVLEKHGIKIDTPRPNEFTISYNHPRTYRTRVQALRVAETVAKSLNVGLPDV